MLQAHLEIPGHMAGTHALHTVEVLPFCNDPCLLHHSFPAVGH